MRFLCQFIGLFFCVTVVYSQTSVSATLQKNSSLTISGTTNVVGFKLYQNGDKLANKKVNFSISEKQDKFLLSDNKLLIAARSFTSTNKMALRDFLTLIRADKYPNLSIEVNSFDVREVSENENHYNSNVKLSIGIAGRQKEYTIPVNVKKDGSLYVANGKKKLTIRDFGLEPTSYMMGMIVLEEWINVEFNLLFDIKEI